MDLTPAWWQAGPLCWSMPGEGIDVDFLFPARAERTHQAKLGQQIRINRSRIKDTSDTNTDFDDIESAIRSGYYLKQGLSNYEDFYYMNILVTITADTLENLEWRVAEVKRLMISQDMDLRVADSVRKTPCARACRRSAILTENSLNEGKAERPDLRSCQLLSIHIL